MQPELLRYFMCTTSVCLTQTRAYVHMDIQTVLYKYVERKYMCVECMSTQIDVCTYRYAECTRLCGIFIRVRSYRYVERTEV